MAQVELAVAERVHPGDHLADLRGRGTGHVDDRDGVVRPGVDLEDESAVTRPEPELHPRLDVLLLGSRLRLGDRVRGVAGELDLARLHLSHHRYPNFPLM